MTGYFGDTTPGCPWTGGSFRTIDRSDASASLAEIAAVQRRTREALNYSGSSTLLLIWGVLVTAGYLLNHFEMRVAQPVRVGLLLAGLAATFAIRAWRSRVKKRLWDGRIHYALLAIVGFGIYWSLLIDPLRGRELAAFWPTLFMLGYVLAGFWLSPCPSPKGRGERLDPTGLRERWVGRRGQHRRPEPPLAQLGAPSFPRLRGSLPRRDKKATAGRGKF